MDKIRDLLIELKKESIDIVLNDDELEVFYDTDDLDPVIYDQIKNNKDQLIQFLKSSKSDINNPFSIPLSPIKAAYPLTNSQNRLWILSQLEGGSLAYNMPAAVRLTGTVDFDKFEESFKLLIKRHEILRTFFKSNDQGEVSQFIIPTEQVSFSITQKSFLNKKNQHESVSDYLEEINKEPFDLEKAPLVRGSIITLKEKEHIFFLSMHHIIGDGWSMQLLISEIVKIYNSLLQGKQANLPELNIQYKDYAVWLNSELQQEKLKSSEDFWLNQFSGELPVLDLPSFKKRPSVQTYNGASLTHEFSKSFLDKLKGFSEKHQSTLFMTLMTGVKVLLHKYSGQDDIVIGTPIAGREHPDLEHQIGLYLNTLAIRTLFKEQNSFLELLNQEKETLLGAYEHQAYPFDELVGKLNLKRDMSRSALFDVLVVLQNQQQVFGLRSEELLSGLQVDSYNFINNTAQFDISFTFAETEGLDLSIEYNTDIYDLELIERMFIHFENLLTKCIEEQDKAIESIDYLTQDEKQQLLVEFNDTKVDYPKDKTIIDLFEEQVDKTPDNIAVVFEEVQLTYKQLNEKANQLAHYLRETYKIQADDLIGIKLERSEQMILAIFGILKSGAAYVPIDPSYPQERIAYIEKDSNCKIVIDEQELGNFYKKQKQYSKSNALKINKPNDLAYVIYTSGTTGNPKGVMVENSSLLDKLLTEKSLYGLDCSIITCFNTNYVFDVSILEIILPLMIGGRIIIPLPSIELVSDDYFDFIAKNKVTILQGTPSYFKNILYVNKTLPSTNSISTICVGGEIFEENIFITLKENFPKASINNHYGPTETVIDVVCNINISEFKSNNIGSPISNTQVYILDESLQPLPIGVTGKLYVSGAGVARGYLNKPELTAEKFISNPFIKGTRMYDTGDLGRWLPDGNIEFLGRNDHQVKIRGYRIELGEIETAISGYSGDMQQIVVEAKEINQDKTLVAYYVSKTEIDKSELRTYLQNKLPEYMVPGFYVEIESLPLTPNGKIDRKALPSVTGEDIIKKDYVAPRNKEEQLIVDVWTSVLKQEAISVKDSFYNLGGDSIKSIQVASRLRQKGYTVKIDSILRNPIVEDLAKLVQLDTAAISQDIIKGPVVLTPIQKLFFEDGTIINKNHYNQSILLKSKLPINDLLLKEALSILVKHHDALRMSYELAEDGWQQYNLDDAKDCFKISFFDLRESKNPKEELNRLGEDLQSGFNLGSGVLFHIGHFRTDNGDQLALIIHHLVIDGVSWRILLEDFSTIYQALETNSDFQLPLKTDSFQKWASLQQSYAKSAVQQQERTYWENLSQTTVALLPKDFEDLDNKAIINESSSFVLDIELTQKLQTQVHNLYSTEINDVLLTALALGIKETFGVEKSVVQMEGHGREEIIDGVDISRTIGWFTSVYPFVLDISENQHPEIVSVKESLRKVPNKGIGYGILKYLDTPFEKELVPSIQFNYLGDFGSNADGKEDSQFEFSGESIGASKDPANVGSDVLLDVSGMMVSGQLSMSIGYSGSLFKQETIEKLVSSYHEHLCILIKELSQRKENRLTPSDLTFKGLSIEDLFRINNDNTIEDIYELSPLQQGMYYHWLSEKSSSTYFEQMSYRIKALDLDIQSVHESYDKLIARHSVLRTSFIYDLSDHPLQIVRKVVPSQFSYQAVPQETDVNDYVEEVKLKDREKGFDLETSFSQMRLQVLDIGDDQYEFIWSHHHILTDGWCMSILINDFYQILNSIDLKIPLNLPKQLPYANYIQWLNKINTNDSMEYWKGYLRNYSQVAEIPFKTLSTENPIYKESKEFLKIEGDLYQRLNSICSQIGVTQNTFIQSVWGYLLSRYNSTQDVVFGAVVSGRPAELTGVENMVGLFINTIPVRVSYQDGSTPLELLTQVHNEAISGNAHHYLNLSEVQSQSELGMNLINHIMVFENYPVQEIIKENVENTQSQKGQELTIESMEVFEQTNYDFSIMVIPTPLSLIVELRYNANKFEPQLIKGIVNHIGNLVEQFSINTDKPLNTLNYLTQGEKQQLLVEFNDTKVDYPKDKTIIDLFEEQVDKTPDNIAVVFEEVQLTYKQLNEKANQLAHYLREEYSIKPNDFVGVKLVKSKEFIIAVLGILKSGAAYVPIDVSYPEERIEYIEQDSNCKVIIDDEELHLFHIQRFRYDSANLDQVNMSTDLAYLIYTSGSTGNPKGVMVEHINVVRLVKPCLYFPLDSTNILLSTGSVSFDATTIEFFGTLLNGSRLILTNQQDLLDMSKLENVIEKNQVNSLWMNASWFNNVVDSNADIFKNINQLIVGGDVVSPVHTQKVFKTNPAIRIVNGYGPTENTTFSITFDIKDREYTTIPIGMPISNTHAYIIDEELQPLPIGVTGKIYVSGDGVSRGYLNKPELTAEKFISNPFIKGTRMYDTGDLGRWLPDGNIEFLGRNDHQVKIRGYRIELGEIETAISGYSEEIQQVVVEAKEINQDKTLVAYYVSKTEIDKSEIRTYLQNKLPEYMVPGFYVEIESLPLTPNGKIDRKALPSVTGEDIIKKDYVAPGNAIEQKMVEIWQEVLGVQKIGITDNFFELGGHSLIVVQVINQISKQLGKTISFNMFFANPTIKAFNKELKQSEYLCIPKAVEDESYPLTASQNRFWILSQLEGGSLAYNMPAAVKLNGNIDIDKFEESFRLLIKRHEILRTYFKSNDQGEVRQFIIPIEQVSFSITQKSFLNKNNQHESVSDYLEEVNKEPFDLEKAPLIRVSLIKLREDEHVFFLSLHHIIGDGWSMLLLISEVVKIYNSLLQGKQANLPELDIQYKDYAVWLNSELQQEKHQASEDFWLNQFSGELPVLDLPSFKKRPSVQTYNGASLTHEFSKSFLDKLKGFSEKHQSTLFMTLMTGVKVLLHKYSGQDDIVIGTPIAGREHPDLEHQIGLYLNTLAIRTLFKEQNSFLELLNQEKETLLGAYEHQAYPFDELVGKLNLKRDMSRSALFDVLVVLQNQQQVFGLRNEESLSGLQVDSYNFTNNTAQFDISFTFVETEGLDLSIEYNTDIYDLELIERIFVHFENLLTKCIEEQDKAIESIDYLTQGEKQQLLVDFNDSKVDYPKDKTIIDLFEEQVDKTPDNIAVVFEEVQLTYKQLNEKANQLAYYLRETYKIQADDLIGIKLERSEQMILAILGILKSGAAYVPIDPSYPQERIAYIEKDSNCKIVIDEQELGNFYKKQKQYSKSNALKINKPNDLAYVIYTSGTTGNPKGVMVEHKNIVNIISNQTREFNIKENENIAQFSNIAFDASVEQIFLAILNGASLTIVNKDTILDIKKTEDFIENNHITHFHAVPIILEKITPKKYPFLKRIISGGDICSLALANQWSKYCNFYNEYGPTETTVTAIEILYNKDNVFSIGKPIDNTQIYILDEGLQPVSIGVRGKLYISGDGVARGYLNKPELTAEKFISNPFIKGTRMYDTGDLGRWLPDGNIEFLGRNDNQVKIRGYRIELGEIETAISGYSGEIQQIVVEAKEINQDKTLVAYYVSKIEIDKSELRTYLQNKLPEYMVPGFYVEIESLPLTPNGKIDRKALPSVTGEDIIKKEYVAPRNAIEEKMVEIWQEVLGVQKIGITDNFFELGGHSLIVVQVINQISKQLGQTISFKIFFANPTIKELNKELKQSEYLDIPKAVEDESYPLTSSQSRLWILSQLEGGSLAYNMPAAVKLKGNIDIDKFEKSFQLLIERHEILRTFFKSNDQGEVSQFIIPVAGVSFTITQKDFSKNKKSEAQVADYLEEINKEPFDLERAPLVRGAIIKLKEKEHVFFLSMHHIIGDGWSMQLLISEIIKIYNSLLQGKQVNLPELNIQYKDYAVWLNSELQQEKHQASEDFWLNQFSGELPVLDLPSFKKRPSVQTYNGASLTHGFSKSFLDKLKGFSEKHQSTLFMTLMTGVKVLLHKYSGQDDIVVGTPIAGREHPDLEHQIGLYLNTLPIRTLFKEQNSFLELLNQEKETLLGAYEHQAYPFDELVGKLNLKRDMSRSALFDVLVVLQNQQQVFGLRNEESLSGLEVDSYNFTNNTAQFDISFTFVETEGLDLSIKYNTDIYDLELIERIFVHFENLLTKCIEEQDKIDYLSQAEKQQLLVEFNDTKVDYPKDKTIIDLFEEQVDKTPDNIAVVFEEVQLTYKQLNEKANQLAYYLRETYKIQADDLIGIKLERSEQMILAILGILKSGAAYVPIDPSYPQERITYIEKDSNCKIVIDEQELGNFYKKQKQYSKSNALKINKPNDLAYVIYTSGTTGNPKGVMVEHKNLVNFISNQTRKFNIKENENIAQFSNIAFDASVEQIFLAILNGASLTIINKDTILDIKKTEDFIENNHITHFHAVPIILEKITPKKYPFLKRIISGGDICSLALANQWSKYCNFYNKYGPTETTVTAIEILYNKDNVFSIGKPIDNAQIYILDEGLQPVSIGVRGKLYISGDGVARGYLNKPELTAEKFISNPFIKGTRMYDTGDLGRWLPDGNIEFLGRNDHQVKIRGYRIELGEIETAISGYSGDMQQIVVEAKEINQDKTLVAYYVSKTEIDKSELRTYLQNKLPEYMVPGFYVEIESLPLTPNGKIDRKALPSVTGEDIIKKDYVAPRNKEEQLIVDVWTSVLKQEAISVKDSFYNLGGDSIKSIQVASRLRQKGYTVKIDSILRNPIVEDLAKLVQLDTAAISQDIIKGPVVLTPIQKLFFEDGTIINKNHYNQSILLKSKLPINDLLLKEALSILVKHHDALRMSYELAEDGWQQYNLDDAKDCFKISFFDLRESKNPKEELNRLGEDLQSGFNLGSGVLFHIGHFRTDNGDQLALIIHHLVIDGVSWRILLEDFSTIYQALETNSDFQLPLKTDSFQKWASLQQSYAKSAVQQQERTYWENLSQTTVALLPKDFEDLDNKAIINESSSFVLDIELTQKLQTQVHNLYSTEINDVLLTALALGIKETFGVEKSVVQMEGHGREEIIDGVDISRTIGWFTSVYPFVLDISENQHPEIVSVKESLRKVPNKGIGYGILKYLDTPFEKELVPSIQFNYLGDFGSNADGKEDSQFEFSGESIGASKDPANVGSDVLLDVSGMMVSGQLSMSIGYSGSLFKQETIEKLVSSYHEHLCILIKELSQRKENRLTPSDLTFKGLSIEDLFRINNDNAIEDIYELSPLQQGMYYHWLSEKSSSMYFEQMSYRIKALDLDIQSVHESYDKLISRHSVLRTSFIYDLSDHPLQIVRKVVPSQFSYQAVPQETDVNDYVEEVKLKDREKGFDLETSFSQMRLQVLDIGDDQYEFIWSHHHILTDGWCMSILINDFYQILNSIDLKIPLNLPKQLPYANYIQWLNKINTNDSMEYWKGYLRNYSQVAEIPFKTLSTENPIYKESKEFLKIEGDLYQRLNSICSQIGVTQNTFIQSVWGYLLSRYNSTQDVVFGAVVSGRPAELTGVENMVGLFINTIPVRVSYQDGSTPLELLTQVHNEAISGNAHHYLNLSEVQSQSELGMNLINHIMVFENYPVQEIIKENVENTQSQKGQELTIESMEVFEQTNYDFSIMVIPTPLSLIVELRYNANKFEPQLIKGIVNHIGNLVEQFSINTDKPLNTLNYLTQGEKQQLLVEFNDTKVDYPKDKTIIDLFEEQVDKTPDNIAVVFEEVQLTYKQLNEKANQLAHYLRETYKIQADDLIGIKLERSEQMILAILGILKSGAAYVPIDPSYPQERIAYIEKDSNCKIVIDEQTLEIFHKIQDKYTKSNILKINKPKDLAYVIYTSGTTGNPKGVMVENSSLINRLEWMQKAYALSDQDVILQKTSYSFDVSVWELFWWIYKGSQVCMLKPEGQKNPKDLIDCIEKYKVSVLHFVPSMLSLFLDFLKENELENERLKSLKQIFVSGEALSVNQNDKFFAQFTDVSLMNLYGPTEVTIDVSYYNCSKGDTLIPIGKPIDNTQIYILDEGLQPVSIGIRGKLYISGDGVARGYLNKPELTAEKFISNPFIKGTRMYDTGDLAKWLPDGNIEFLGRNDHQVKIRGYRIELGEIETAISGYSEEIQQVVVEAKEINQDKTLVAYYVSKTEIDKSEIRTYLQNKLPEYMVPGFYVEIESLPLTPNGKIDRKALPSVTGEDIIKKEYVAPGNAIEQKMVEIWQEVLGVQKIGITDNFFELGGHSLIVVQVINQISKQLGQTISFKIFFANPTIKELSKELKQSEYLDIPKAVEDESYPLTSSQNRFWILSQLEGGSLAYNMSAAVRFIGTVDYDKFEESFRLLIKRHEILRTYFKSNDQAEVRQFIIPTEQVSFSITQKSFLNNKNQHESVSDYLEEVNKEPFDLEKAPLIRASLIKLREDEHVFFLLMHHIIGDGWSMQLLISEIVKIYNSLLQGKQANLPELNIQYKDYAVWLNSELQKEKHQASEDFWLNQFSGELPVLDLPSFKKRPSVQTYNGASLTHGFSKSFLDKLKGFSEKHQSTLFMTLMTGVKVLLHKYSGQDDIVVGTPIAGREHPDLEHQIGLYLNTLPIRTLFKEQNSFLELLNQEKETLLGAYEHQAYPFDELVGKLNLKRDMSRSALFDVLVVLQNQGRLNNFNSEGLTNLEVSEYPFSRRLSKFDIIFTFTEIEELNLTIEYNTDIYDDYLIERMFTHFDNLLTKLINEPETTI